MINSINEINKLILVKVKINNVVYCRGILYSTKLVESLKLINKFEKCFDDIKKPKSFEYFEVQSIHKNMIIFIKNSIKNSYGTIFDNYISLTDWIWDYIKINDSLSNEKNIKVSKV